MNDSLNIDVYVGKLISFHTCPRSIGEVCRVDCCLSERNIVVSDREKRACDDFII